MTKPKLTPWINRSIKPDLKGFYERDYCTEITMDYFDGLYWRVHKNSLDILHHSLNWRGLAKNPNKGKKK